jgi:hypothetical protein
MIGNRDWYFEVGQTTSYGTVVKPGVIVLGYTFPANTATEAVVGITGLQRNTTYHYRLVAENFAGKAYGDDATFTTPANLPPTASNAFANAAGPDPVPVFCDFQDPDGDSLTVSVASNPAHGTVTVGSDVLGGDLTYTPNETFAGEDQFTYTVTDEFGGSATATVYVANLREKSVGRYVTTIVAGNRRAVGEVAISLTSTGRFTGALRLLGVRHPIRGQFSLDGFASLEIDQVGQPSITLNLGLFGSDLGIRLSGVVLTPFDDYDVEPDVALIFPDDPPRQVRTPSRFLRTIPPSRQEMVT